MGIAKRLNLVMVSAFALLLGCLMFTMQPTYALEEKSVSSWSELESNFKTAENTITIPEDTIVTVNRELRVPSGNYNIVGGGILQRGEVSGNIISVGSGTTLYMENITISGEPGDAIRLNNNYGSLTLKDCNLKGQTITRASGYRVDVHIEGGEVATVNAFSLSLKDAKVTDYIDTQTSVEIRGNVQITAAYGSRSQAGYYTITGSLGNTASISLSGWFNSGRSSGYYGDDYTYVYWAAVPGSDYTITEQDFKAFKINHDSSKWIQYNDSYNLIMYSDIESEEMYEHGDDGKILIWTGPKLRPEVPVTDPSPDEGEDEEQDPTTPSNPGETSGNMSIYGTVQPITMIDVTVPLTIQFTIESDRTFTGPDSIKIKSNCPSPLDVNLYGVNKDGSAPSLVAPDTHSDNEWNNLSRAETLASIALMLDNTSLSSTGSTLGRIDSAFQGEKALDLDLSAKYGKAWDNSEDLVFTYNVVFEFAMP